VGGACIRSQPSWLITRRPQVSILTPPLRKARYGAFRFNGHISLAELLPTLSRPTNVRFLASCGVEGEQGCAGEAPQMVSGTDIVLTDARSCPSGLQWRSDPQLHRLGIRPLSGLAVRPVRAARPLSGLVARTRPA
jgi:hypothetical protein